MNLRVLSDGLEVIVIDEFQDLGHLAAPHALPKRNDPQQHKESEAEQGEADEQCGSGCGGGEVAGIVWEGVGDEGIESGDEGIERGH